MALMLKNLSKLQSVELSLPPVQEFAEGKTLVIVPTYNESENIRLVLDIIFSLEIPDLDVLVVDDNSPDGTAAVVKAAATRNKHIHLIVREGKLGLGTAYARGFKFALEKNYDFVMEMDADLSHDPRMIPYFLAAVKEADLVIGSRYLGEVANVVNWPLSRLFLSVGASLCTECPFKTRRAASNSFVAKRLRL
jgi:dolichol-phosphate mannosyltransferase